MIKSELSHDNEIFKTCMSHHERDTFQGKTDFTDQGGGDTSVISGHDGMRASPFGNGHTSVTHTSEVTDAWTREESKCKTVLGVPTWQRMNI